MILICTKAYKKGLILGLTYDPNNLAHGIEFLESLVTNLESENSIYKYQVWLLRFLDRRFSLYCNWRLSFKNNREIERNDSQACSKEH